MPSNKKYYSYYKTIISFNITNESVQIEEIPKLNWHTFKNGVKVNINNITQILKNDKNEYYSLHFKFGEYINIKEEEYLILKDILC